MDALSKTLSQVNSSLLTSCRASSDHSYDYLARIYIPKGEMPQKVQYQYPTKLSWTETHETLIAALCRPKSASFSASPIKTITVIFNDTPTQHPTDRDIASAFASMQTLSAGGELEGINANINTGPLSSLESAISVSNTNVTGKTLLVVLERPSSRCRRASRCLQSYIGERKYYDSDPFSEHWLEKKLQTGYALRWLSDEPFVMHSFGCCASMSCLNLGVCAGVTLIKHPMSRHLAFCRSMLSPGVKEALVDLSILHARWHTI